MVRALKQWEHYLVQKEFILFCDHQSLRFLNPLRNLSRMYSRWVLVLQKFNFLFKHKKGKQNVVVDALSMRVHLLTVIKLILHGLRN